MEENREFKHRSNGVFCVKVTDPNKKEATIDWETLERYRKEAVEFFGEENLKKQQIFAKNCQRFAEKALRGEDVKEEIFR